MIDKSGVFGRLAAGERLHIELGCGPRKRDASAIGVDAIDFPSVDLVADVREALAAFPDHSVSSVYSAHFLEHVDDVRSLLAEVARVTISGGRITIIVPHFSNPFYYSDPTHRTPFGLYTLAYLCRESIFRRKIPHYGAPLPLSLVSATLHFKSYPPRYIRHGLKRTLGILFNASVFTRELYEENFCWIFPCYELRFGLLRD